MTNIQVRSVYFFILSYNHIIILPSPSKSSTLGRKSIKSEALHVITVVETQIFLQIMPPVSDDTFFPTRQGRERSGKLMPFIGRFAWQFLLSYNSSVSEKECGLGFQKGVNHTCSGEGSLSPLQTTFSQLLFMFIKLGFEIFEL